MYFMYFAFIFALAKRNVGQSAEITSPATEINFNANIETTTQLTLNEQVDVEPLDIPEYKINDDNDDVTSPRTTSIDRVDTSFLKSGNDLRLEDDDGDDDESERDEADDVTKYDKGRNLLFYLMDLQLLPKIHFIDNPLRAAAIKFTSSLATRTPSKLQMLRNMMSGGERQRERISTRDLN